MEASLGHRVSHPETHRDTLPKTIHVNNVRTLKHKKISSNGNKRNRGLGGREKMVDHKMKPRTRLYVTCLYV